MCGNGMVGPVDTRRKAAPSRKRKLIAPPEDSEDGDDGFAGASAADEPKKKNRAVKVEKRESTPLGEKVKVEPASGSVVARAPVVAKASNFTLDDLPPPRALSWGKKPVPVVKAEAADSTDDDEPPVRPGKKPMPVVKVEAADSTDDDELPVRWGKFKPASAAAAAPVVEKPAPAVVHKPAPVEAAAGDGDETEDDEDDEL